MKQWLKEVREELRKRSINDQSINKIIKDQHALIKKEYQKNTSATDMADQLDKLLVHSSEYSQATTEPMNIGKENRHPEKIDTKAENKDTEKTGTSSPSAKNAKNEDETKQSSAISQDNPVSSQVQVAQHKKQKFSVVTLLGGVLIGALLGICGTAVYSNNGMTDTSQVVLKINGKDLTSNEMVKMTGSNDYSGQLLNAYKTNVMAKALNDKYGSKEFKPAIDREVEYVKKHSGGDMQLTLQQYQVKSFPQLRKRLLFQLQLQKYIDSKVTNKDLKDAYKEYLPDQKFTYIGYADPKLAQKELKNLNKVGYTKFAKEHKKQMYDVTLNSANNGLRDGQFAKIGNLKVHDGGLAQTQSGQYLLIIKLKSAKKGSFDSLKPQLKSVAKQKKLSDPNLATQLINDFHIKGNSKVGNDIVSAMKADKPTK